MLVALVLGFLLFSLIWNMSGRRKGLPPGPTCYPIIGNVAVIKSLETVQGHRRLKKTYGDIYSLMIFHKTIIYVHGYDNIRELFLKHGDMFSERPHVFATDVIRRNKGMLYSFYCILSAHKYLSIYLYIWDKQYPCKICKYTVPEDVSKFCINFPFVYLT
jgi:hypothetical protein